VQGEVASVVRVFFGLLGFLLLVAPLVSRAAVPPPIVETQTFAIEGFDLSPDGTKLLWLSYHGNDKELFFRDLYGGPVTLLPQVTGASMPHWAGDNRHIMVMSDPTGGERDHLLSFDSADPKAAPIDLTPFPGKKILLIDVNNPDGSALVAVTLESEQDFSIYRVGPGDRKPVLVEAPAAGSLTWMTDFKGRLFGRVRAKEDGHLTLETKLPGQAKWQSFDLQGLVTRPGDGFVVSSEPAKDNTVWMLMRNQSDVATIQHVDLTSGKVLETWPGEVADAERVMFDADQRPLLVQSIPDYPLLRVYDPDLRRLLGTVPLPLHSFLKETSFDLSINKLLLLFVTDTGEENLLFVDRKQGVAQVLFHQASALVLAQPPKTVPVTIPARDGLTLHGYLSWPANVAPKSLPTVLAVHGGPWARDQWGFDFNALSLTLQGYAVLRVNYRGSTGYGRAFEDAGRHEWGGRMQDDLTDAVCWAIGQGVADPSRIAVVGGSYGGYAALEALERTPRLYVAGVDHDGPVDLPAMLAQLPAFSQKFRGLFDLYIASDQATQWERSPLAHIERIERPVLAFQGNNDPRVQLSQTQSFEKAMKQAGKPLQVSYFADEGHNLSHANNIPTYLLTLTNFLRSSFGAPNGPDDYKPYCGQ
jgi:dipeptidyl aminopeptidase/acylaminoacyl peptidase